MNKRNNQFGFSHLVVLIVLLVITIIGASAYFLFQKQAGRSSSNQNNPPSSASRHESGWTSYASTDGKFHIKLPDGWKLKEYSDAGVVHLYALGNDQLKPAPGTKVSIKKMSTNEVYWENYGQVGEGIDITYPAKVGCGTSTQPVPFKLDNGGDALKCSATVDQALIDTWGDSGDMVAGLELGGKLYSYLAAVKPDVAVSLAYGVNHGQTDYHTLVETVFKTISLSD